MSDRERLRTTFSTVAELYARVRPGYPAAAFDDLIDLAALQPGARVLEIGCGTGQATRPLAERGMRLTCVELGAEMADVARRELADLPNVEVITSSFEAWPLPPEGFDLVFAATAFHWIERSHAEPKVAEALRPGGALGVLTNEHVFGGSMDFFRQVQRCYERFMPGTPPDLPMPMHGDSEPLVRDIAETGLFDEATVRTYGFDASYSTAEYLDLLSTYSGHIDLADDLRASLFECIATLIDGSFGGRIVKHYETTLVIARRRVEN